LAGLCLLVSTITGVESAAVSPTGRELVMTSVEWGCA